jgi:hypothetical protein
MNMLIISANNDIVITMLESFLCNSQKAVCYLNMHSAWFPLMFSYEAPRYESLRFEDQEHGWPSEVCD